MAFTIKPDGTITVDTAEELRIVLAVKDQASSTQAKQEAKVSAPQPVARERPVHRSASPQPSLLAPDMDAAFQRMFEDASDAPQQQEFMRVLVGSGRRMFSDAELRERLGLSTNFELRGLLIGTMRRAKNRGLPSPYERQVIRHGRASRDYKYGATPEFRRAMAGYIFKEQAM